MLGILKNMADNTNKKSLSHRFRQRRFRVFLEMVRSLPKPISILDIGGTLAFWEGMGFSEDGVTITLLNLEVQHPLKPCFISITGDATALDFDDQSFDIVFSNSVIEHLYTFEQQQKMATEVQRVGKTYFIQTPNYWFPIEPHWVFPFFQYLPFNWRVWLTQHFPLGHIPRQNERSEAERQVREIRLMTKAELQSIFPKAQLYRERFLFFTKSFVMKK
ncbi:MAG: methyltransferase domain-containing protein [Sediminibacterium sp.]|jgi:predicted SAM-dependent methyltransferase|nr:class I SAM-dependent methyltransferase [Sediminibacterium sp.]MBW0161169.1 methyltransferase domain-containing protein [Sediminibacterium sp.]MBW0164455.1 methyltransferase domain-containing protein [Sediminibacterium sp.]